MRREAGKDRRKAKRVESSCHFGTALILVICFIYDLNFKTMQVLSRTIF